MPRIESRRACDRCHALKERCHWRQDQPSSPCARCDRLGFECLAKRPSKKPGRPRQFASKLRASYSTDDPSPSGPMLRDPDREGRDLRNLYSALGPVIPRCLPHFNDLTSSDQVLIQDILFGNAAMDRFLLGPSFRERHRSCLVSHFVISRHALKDAYLALALAFVKQTGIATPDQHDPRTQYKHASSALRHLREYSVHSSQGVSECLVLGALIMSFTYYCSAKPDALPVCSQTLGLIKDSYESNTVLCHDDLVFISCLILPEIFHCLMRGTVPTLRFRQVEESETYVDRFIGLFSPLLPYVHDICELNNALSFADHQDLHEILNALDRIELAVTAWRPCIPQDFTTHFTATEVSHMLCQAQVMRLGTLLLIHRLRFPFGSNPGPALAMATSILTQLDLTRTATNKSILSITLPLVIACFEVQGESERQMWLSRVPHLVGYSSDFASYLQGLISTFWEAQNDRQFVSWYNMRHFLGLSV